VAESVGSVPSAKYSLRGDGGKESAWRKLGGKWRNGSFQSASSQGPLDGFWSVSGKFVETALRLLQTVFLKPNLQRALKGPVVGVSAKLLGDVLLLDRRSRLGQDLLDTPRLRTPNPRLETVNCFCEGRWAAVTRESGVKNQLRVNQPTIGPRKRGGAMADTERAIKDLADALYKLGQAVESLAKAQGDGQAQYWAGKARRDASRYR
jgi:hypothetical protein